MRPMRVSFSTIESGVFGFRRRLVDEFRCRQVWLVHLHEVDAHEERLAGLAVAIEIIQRRLLDVLVEERDPDDTLVQRVDVLAVDLEILARRLAGISRQRTLGHLLEHFPQLRVHVRKPLWVGIRVGVEMIKPAILHLVVALRVGQGIVCLTEMPLADEEGLVARGLQYGRECPLGCRQAAALALKRNRRHAAAIWDAARLHRGASRRAARLRIE